MCLLKDDNYALSRRRALFLHFSSFVFGYAVFIDHWCLSWKNLNHCLKLTTCCLGHLWRRLIAERLRKSLKVEKYQLEFAVQHWITSWKRHHIVMPHLKPVQNKLYVFIAPLWKSGGYTGFALSFRDSVTVILSFRNLSNENVSSHFSQELWGLEDWNLVHTWTVGKCIVYTGIRLLLLIRLFISSFFFLSNFQTLNIFITLFSRTVRPRRLKLGTHVDYGWIYCAYRNQAAASYSSLYYFIFLSNFQTLKYFVTLFSGTVRPRRLKLSTHVDSGQMYRVY